MMVMVINSYVITTVRVIISSVMYAHGYTSNGHN